MKDTKYNIHATNINGLGAINVANEYIRGKLEIIDDAPKPPGQGGGRYRKSKKKINKSKKRKTRKTNKKIKKKYFF